MRILFIGNSYTFCNDLPAALARLMMEANPSVAVETDMSVVGGFSFERHVKETGALGKIRQATWDVVVLQDKSTGPVDDPASMHEYGRILGEEAKAAGARVVLYMTWARQHIPDMIETLAAEYAALAEKLGADVAPVGRAWQRSLEKRPELPLHVEDRSHPNQHGSYLAACTFFAALTGKSPEGLSNAGLDDVGEGDARFLQRVAWDAWREQQ